MPPLWQVKSLISMPEVLIKVIIPLLAWTSNIKIVIEFCAEKKRTKEWSRVRDA